nr:phage baseplate assembly protein V [Methylogaea oryzae]
MVSPDAGKDRGYCFRPEVGDEVVIGFINQDPRQPIVLGALFGSVNKPPQRFGEPKDANTGRGIASKKGSLFGFDDEKVRIYLETPAGNKITLDDDAKSIVLADQHGNTVTLDQNGISLKSAKDLKLEASGNVTISGAKVDVQ